MPGGTRALKPTNTKNPKTSGVGREKEDTGKALEELQTKNCRRPYLGAVELIHWNQLESLPRSLQGPRLEMVYLEPWRKRTV